MDKFTIFPNPVIVSSGPISEQFLSQGIDRFIDACRFVHELPYGYNSDRDDPMILFQERFGSCTTKHAAIATLAGELGLPVQKAVGIYAMTEDIVAGANAIVEKYELPYVPMLHCFLVHGGHCVDLTEGNRNGKKRSIEEFLHTEPVSADISAKVEYLLYRRALSDRILRRKEFAGIEVKRILHAREEGIALLKANLKK